VLRKVIALIVATVASYALWVGALSVTARLRAPADGSLRGAILGLNVDSTRILIAGAGLFMSALHLLGVAMTARRAPATALGFAAPLALVPVAIDYGVARAVDPSIGAGTHAAVWAAAAIAMTAIAWAVFALLRESAPPPPAARPPESGRTSID
jgi:hypothetical protein